MPNDRPREAAPGRAGLTNRRSRVVAWLKIVLPLTALVLLSTLFLLARERPTQGVAATSLLTEGGVAREGIAKPIFSGTNMRGDLMTITAERVQLGVAESVSAEAVQTILILNDGSRLEIRAGSAIVEPAQTAVRLQNTVTVSSSAGYDVTAPSMMATIDPVRAEAAGPIQATGPAGTLTAGAMALQTDGSGDGQNRLVFTDGVRVVYTPG